MLAVTLSSLKDATSHLFTKPTFDGFDVLAVTISSYITFSMDGHLNAAFFEDQANDQSDDQSTNVKNTSSKLCSWSRLRPVCFSIIKGKQPPVSFQITLFLDREQSAAFFEESALSENQDIEGFTLHFSYKNRVLTLSTGTVFSRFSLDRDSERVWDHSIYEWLKTQAIEFDEV